MRYTARAALLAAALLAAACAKGPEKAPPELEVLRAVGDWITQARTPPQKPVVLTRAQLEDFGQPLLEVRIEDRDVSAYLIAGLSREDSSQPGRIEVWRTQDNVSVAFRQGMVIATRGLGGGLISARVPAAAGSPGPAGGGARSYVLRDRGNGQTRIDMACSLQDLGAETIEIVEVKHATRHLQERCEGGGGVIVNDYWVDSRPGGRVWQSRQWAGPGVGYIRTRQLQI